MVWLLICCNLGYPIGRDMHNEKLLEWIPKFIINQFMYWKSQAQLFHIRLNGVRIIMIPGISYYFPLLPWLKKTFEKLSTSMWFILWKRKRRLGLRKLAWSHRKIKCSRSMVIHHFLVSWHRLSEFFERQPAMENTNRLQLKVLAKSCIEWPCSIKLISERS